MAPTPKRSLKRTLASTVEGRGPRFLFSWLAGAMVISLIAGLGIGIKIEQHRIRTKNSAASSAKKKTTTKPTAATRTARITGTVAVVKPAYVIVAVGKRRVRLTLTKFTAVYATSSGSHNDLVAGSRILVKLKPKTTSTTAKTSTTKGAVKRVTTAAAQEIVVLPARATVGGSVTSVSASSLELQFTAKSVITVTTTGTKFDKGKLAARAALKVGARVVIQTLRRVVAKRVVISATQIVVLPSTFG